MYQNIKCSLDKDNIDITFCLLVTIHFFFIGGGSRTGEEDENGAGGDQRQRRQRRELHFDVARDLGPVL